MEIRTRCEPERAAQYDFELFCFHVLVCVFVLDFCFFTFFSREKSVGSNGFFFFFHFVFFFLFHVLFIIYSYFRP